MDPRLEAATHAGDLEALHQLLREDTLLLDHLDATVANNPLHIAALLGHADFTRAIFQKMPEFARALDAGGHTPLHLASARGHLAVVLELLDAVISNPVELCRLRDKDGLMPIHSAAAKGRLQVLSQLIEAYPESGQELTCRGETVLHLAVKSNCYEAVEFLTEKLDEILNTKDENGNTVLHLATARRQLRIIKLLLTKPGIDVNAANLRGLKPLDVLLESPSEHGDLALGEMIVAAGRNSTIVEEGRRTQQPAAETTPPLHEGGMLRRRWFRLGPPRSGTSDSDDSYANTPETLMVVATLIATITFSAVLNPPGGLDDKSGTAKMSKKLGVFLITNIIGLFTSLSIILLLICVVPRRKKMMMRFLVWVMWLSVYSTALAFTAAAFLVFPDSKTANILLQGWLLILIVAMLWVYLRLAVYLLRLAGWWKMKQGDGVVPRMGAALVLKRIVLLVVACGCPYLAGYLILSYDFLSNDSNTDDWNIYVVKVFSGIVCLVFQFPELWLCIRFVLYLLRVAGCFSCNRDGENNFLRMEAKLVVKRIIAVLLIVATVSGVGYEVYYFIIASLI